MFALSISAWPPLSRGRNAAIVFAPHAAPQPWPSKTLAARAVVCLGGEPRQQAEWNGDVG